MKNRLYGILLSLILSLFVVLLFFGNTILNLDKRYFTASGDGFKAYYCALYHVKYDTVNSLSGGMNYPFGELIAYTDSQPLISNTARLLNRLFSWQGEWVIGAINGAMLLAFVLGALFIFLILYDLGVAWWFGALAAVGISMLSPQVARFGGHYSLSWLVWIPALIYWIMRFDKSRSWIFTILIGLTTFLAGKMHMYFLGFAGFMIGGYWIWRFLRYRKSGSFWYRDLLNFFLQFLLPVMILQAMVLVQDEMVDRTAFPYGFEIYRAHPAGVFLPSGKPWTFVPRFITVFSHLSWESLSYIGIPAVSGILAAFVLWIRRTVKKIRPEARKEFTVISLMTVISVAALLFSFGIPFIFGLEALADHIGPVRQLRALGRFAWLFYYVVNMLVFAALYRKAFLSPASLHWKIIAGLAFLLLFYEGYWNMEGNTREINNRIVELEDHENALAENQWVHEIKPEDYSAIIPVPYFHVGSESIWIDGGHQSRETTMLVSLKTGLPTTGVELSRTSISQTFLNYALFKEPLQRLEVADFLPDEKPFLVLLMKDYTLTESEQWLLKGAKPVLATDRFSFLSLPVGTIRNLHETWRLKNFHQFDNTRLFQRDNFLVSDSLSWFMVKSFDDNLTDKSYHGTGAFTFSSRKWAVAWSDTLKNVPAGKNLILGFWIRDYQKDACLRTNLELFQKNSVTGESTSYLFADLFHHIKAFSGNWALIELDFSTHSENEVIQLSFLNKVLPKADIVLDELLVREKGTDIWTDEGKYLYKNGRKFTRR